MVAFRLAAQITNGRQVVESALSRGLELKHGTWPTAQRNITVPGVVYCLPASQSIDRQLHSPSAAVASTGVRSTNVPQGRRCAIGTSLVQLRSRRLRQPESQLLTLVGSWYQGGVAVAVTVESQARPRRSRGCQADDGSSQALLVLLNFHSQVEAPSQGGNSVE
jgi:hypothetical protein